MDKTSDMAGEGSLSDSQRLEALGDFVTCFRLINRIGQRLQLISDLEPGGSDVAGYWTRTRSEIEQLASIEAAARKAYHSAIRAGFSTDPRLADAFPILHVALSAIASALGHAFDVCAAAAARLDSASVAFSDQVPWQREDKSS